MNEEIHYSIIYSHVFYAAAWKQVIGTSMAHNQSRHLKTNARLLGYIFLVTGTVFRYLWKHLTVSVT